MLSINPSEIPMPKLHEHLLSAVAPRPVAFVSTIDKAGNVNLSPFSFFNCFGANPPTLVFSPARSGRTGETKHTHDNVLEVPECVVNIPHFDIIHQMNLAAGMYPKDVNEFAKSGLTAIASQTVKPPRVAECYVQFECVVKQVIETGPNGGAGNLIVCEVTMLHINENVLNAEGSIDPLKMNYIARLGKQFWCRVGADNIITLPSFQMANNLGMGFDALPKMVRESQWLTGNNLALLASLVSIPTQEEIAAALNVPAVQEAIEMANDDAAVRTKLLHQLAKVETERGNLQRAFCVAMLPEQL